MCTPTCLDFVRRALTAEEVRGKSIFEAGSYNANGSPRDVIQPLQPSSYIGADMRPGPGVDVVVDAGHLIERFGREQMDILVTTEMFEHCRDWRGVLHNLKGMVKPGGLLIMTTRSQGFPYHEWPFDFWRFSLDDMKVLFEDFEILSLEPDSGQPGVFIKARKPLQFKEKNLEHYDLYCMIKQRRHANVSSLDCWWLSFGNEVKQFWGVRLPELLKPLFSEKTRKRLEKWVHRPLLDLFHADRRTY